MFLSSLKIPKITATPYTSNGIFNSVAKPEPVDRQLFVEAGTEVFWTGFRSGYDNSYKMLQKGLNSLN
jgi:hypothetical protein